MKDLFPKESLDLIREVSLSFRRAANLWLDYCRSHEGKEGHNSDLAGEIAKRIKQLSFIFNKIVTLEEKSRVNADKMVRFVIRHKIQAPRAILKEDSEVGFEVELLTECFYYLAFRLLKVADLLTGLKLKNKSKGICNVRNHLIEHSELKDSQVFIISFAHVGPNGPVIKAARYSHQIDKWKDAGLYKNTKEMLDVIIQALS